MSRHEDREALQALAGDANGADNTVQQYLNLAQHHAAAKACLLDYLRARRGGLSESSQGSAGSAPWSE